MASAEREPITGVWGDIKSLPRHSIYVMHFKLVELISIDCYFFRKREIERSETGVNVSISAVSTRQAKMRNEHWHEMDIRKIVYCRKQAM